MKDFQGLDTEVATERDAVSGAANMDRYRLLVRAGFYFGRAARDLGDMSYAERYIGRGKTLTEADAFIAFAEIQKRLVDAGKIGPDEDPFQEFAAPTASTDPPSSRG